MTFTKIELKPMFEPEANQVQGMTSKQDMSARDYYQVTVNDRPVNDVVVCLNKQKQ